MNSDLENSAIAFAKMWCNLFVGDEPDIERATRYFAVDASIWIPGVPYRIDREVDREEIVFSHRVDGRGHIHFWQVIEPNAVIVDEVGIVTYYARYNIGRRSESTTKCAKETLILRRDGEEWTILHMHNSPA